MRTLTPPKRWLSPPPNHDSILDLACWPACMSMCGSWSFIHSMWRFCCTVWVTAVTQVRGAMPGMRPRCAVPYCPSKICGAVRLRCSMHASLLPLGLASCQSIAAASGQQGVACGQRSIHTSRQLGHSGMHNHAARRFEEGSRAPLMQPHALSPSPPCRRAVASTASSPAAQTRALARAHNTARAGHALNMAVLTQTKHREVCVGVMLSTVLV